MKEEEILSFFISVISFILTHRETQKRFCFVIIFLSNN